MAYEQLIHAHQRRVYVTRKRGAKNWRWAQAVPMDKADLSHRSASLVERPDGSVLLYLRAGDSRRGRGWIRVFRAWGDDLNYRPLVPGRLPLLFPLAASLTQPWASADGAKGVLLTVTRRRSGAADGCYLQQSTDGWRFGKPSHLGAGERCRVQALGPADWVLTYQRRARRTLPFRGYYRRTADGGTSWSAPQLVSKARETFDVQTLGPGKAAGSLRFLFALRLGSGSGIQLATHLGPSITEQRLTRSAGRRDLMPCGLTTPAGRYLFWAREVRALDFDVLVRAPTSSLPPRPAPPPRRAPVRPRHSR